MGRNDGIERMSRGHDRERAVRQLLEMDGWVCIRAAGSLGPVDVVALKQGEIPKFIEVKSTHRGPFHSFGPAERDEMISTAVKAGAIPWLVWWPVRRDPVWLAASAWPATKEAALP